MVGIAVPGGMTSLERWLRICGVDDGDEEGEALVRRWRSAHEKGEQSFQQFRQAELSESLRFARSLSGVVGVHLLPIEQGGVNDLLAFMSQRRRDHPEGPLI
eukprot:3296807-Pyramimonas_sp.AAC.1